MRPITPPWKKVPVSSLGGLLAIGVFSLCAAVSILMYPGSFSPFENWLGDFGFPHKNPAGAAYYNAGSMLGGLLLLLFYAGFSQWSAGGALRQATRTAGQVSGALSGVSLFVSGYLTPAVMPENMIASIAFFLLTAVAILLFHLTYRDAPDYGESTAIAGIAMIALTALLGISFLIGIETVLAEWCTVLAIFAWVGLMARDSFHFVKRE